MAEQIVRKEVFVVESSELDGYGNLIVIDKGANSHKIGVKRPHLFDVFQPDTAVEVGYATYRDREYIADAVKVEGELPTEKANPVPEHTPKSEVPIVLTKDQRLKHRAFALSYACRVAAGGHIGVNDIRRWAEEFEKFLNFET